jgi:acetylornithine deacetylase/succinyl-diaminopimelate desuccinylase-like protein
MEIDAVLARIKREDVIDLALALGNVDSPHGQEGEVGNFIESWLASNGFTPRRIGLVPDRASVVATLRGSGGGYSLLFNSHMDTSTAADDVLTLRNPRAPQYHSAWLEDDEIVGDGVVNDKGPMAAFLIAARAIKDAGAPLLGDLTVTAVPGEIGVEPVDEWQGLEHVSKDLGARYMVNHGVVADYALVAEGTGFGLVWVEAGKAHFRITIHTDTSSFYTPYLPARTTMAEAPNAVLRVYPFLEAFERWATEYEQRFRYESPGGVVIPKASVNAIRGGTPTRCTQSPQLCHLYADVRLLPNQDVLAVKAELEDLLRSSGTSGEVELFLYRRGYEAQGVERLADTIRRCHQQVFPEPPATVSPAVSSMWRDTNIFIEMGIPAISYAPRSATHATRRSMKADWLYQAALVYARIALDMCNQQKERGAAPASG